MTKHLEPVVWADPVRDIRIKLYDVWTPKQLASLMEAAQWDGGVQSLCALISENAGMELEIVAERTSDPDDGTTFVLWPKGGARPDRVLFSPVTQP